MTEELKNLLAARAKVASMTDKELDEMRVAQRESFVRGQMGWPKPKYKMINGAKVYDIVCGHKFYLLCPHKHDLGA
jgi:hypothetical protein